MPAESTPETLVYARDLEKRYGDKAAVRGIDLDIAAGEAFGFLGSNGAGKSTTMRMIGCVSIPTSGQLTVLGLDPQHDGVAIRSRLGVVPQQDTLDSMLTVHENLEIYARYFGISGKLAKRKASELLTFVKLSDRSKDKVDELSGGMKRRLAIARGLVNDPEMIILDEPTTGLDPQARHMVWERLFQLKQRGVSILLTTHYMDEAEQLCDRLVVMDNGKIIAQGSPSELITEHVTKEVVELRFNGAHTTELADLAEKLADLDGQIEALPDRILIYTNHASGTVAEVRDRGLEPSSAYERRATLEDVYLRLTGRTLAEA
ncbi:ABC transporter ATP-binding protein [Natronoglycomyces albus]|uniref:ABC transporter ATP-binding protein n=1 Tax=Natronoglycomyces albus TaxID=2811108 RepID=A0A895XMX6_9ACTN|nr:ABC transporter ATP-binding protein [Natronoglycomyces albus]QSB04385.1 ABC transporter ATP-binding protein [Natronoglycomyces albus]